MASKSPPFQNIKYHAVAYTSLWIWVALLGDPMDVGFSVYAAPNTAFHFDSWVDPAIEKLETDGVAGGFHRNTRPRTRR